MPAIPRARTFRVISLIAFLLLINIQIVAVGHGIGPAGLLDVVAFRWHDDGGWFKIAGVSILLGIIASIIEFIIGKSLYTNLAYAIPMSFALFANALGDDGGFVAMSFTLATGVPALGAIALGLFPTKPPRVPRGYCSNCWFDRRGLPPDDPCPDCGKLPSRVCAQCSYNLRGVPINAPCPECGTLQQ